MLIAEKETNPKSQKTQSNSYRFIGVGLEMGLAMGIGIVGGKYLDTWLGTKPWFFWFGFLLGLAAAFKALYDAAVAAQKAIKEDEPSSSDED